MTLRVPRQVASPTAASSACNRPEAFYAAKIAKHPESAEHVGRLHRVPLHISADPQSPAPLSVTQRPPPVAARSGVGSRDMEALSNEDPKCAGEQEEPLGAGCQQPHCTSGLWLGDCGSGTGRSVTRPGGWVSLASSSVGGSASKQGVRQLHGTVASDRPRV